MQWQALRHTDMALGISVPTGACRRHVVVGAFVAFLLVDVASPTRHRLPVPTRHRLPVAKRSRWTHDVDGVLGIGQEKCCENAGVMDQALRDLKLRLPTDLLCHTMDMVAVCCQVALFDLGGTPFGVKLWGPDGARQVFARRGSDIQGAEFFPFSGRLLTWARDGALVVWDTASGNQVGEFFVGGRIVCARALRSDSVIACSDRGSCSL